MLPIEETQKRIKNGQALARDIMNMIIVVGYNNVTEDYLSEFIGNRLPPYGEKK